MKILYLPNHYSQQRQREKKRKIYPIRLSMEAEYYRQAGHEVDFDPDPRFPYPDEYFDVVITEPEGLPFLDLPPPDRIFTRAFDKKYQQNGNFKHKPATYILSASGCWWGKCKFCVENGCKYEVRPVFDVVEEVRECEKMGFREVFDDSGTFPVDDEEWFNEFVAMKEFEAEIPISCNMRFDKLSYHDYFKMKMSNFRMLLYGLESANQKTLDKINKGIDIKHAIEELKMVSSLGLEAHIAVMFGYPWETDEEALNTLELVWYLLKKGYAKTAQASFYDTIEESNEAHRKYVPKIYNVAKYPEFWFNQVKDIRNIDDLKYLWTKIKNGLKRGK